MAYGSRKEIKAIIRQLEDQGWTVEIRRGGHYRAKAPDGKGIAFFPVTPSDHRGLKNLKADLRKLGAKIR